MNQQTQLDIFCDVFAFRRITNTFKEVRVKLWGWKFKSQEVSPTSPEGFGNSHISHISLGKTGIPSVSATVDIPNTPFTVTYFCRLESRRENLFFNRGKKALREDGWHRIPNDGEWRNAVEDWFHFIIKWINEEEITDIGYFDDGVRIHE
tara:strand:+ start:207 stop:656 length:450 start_codon:yes stop_codon:yes gene_type:complete